VTQSSSLSLLPSLPSLRNRVNFHHDYDDGAARSAPSPLGHPPDAATRYFGLLLDAVTVRLQRAADAAHAESMATSSEAALHRFRLTVVECVEALEQLHATQRNVRHD